MQYVIISNVNHDRYNTEVHMGSHLADFVWYLKINRGKRLKIKLVCKMCYFPPPQEALNGAKSVLIYCIIISWYQKMICIQTICVKFSIFVWYHFNQIMNMAVRETCGCYTAKHNVTWSIKAVPILICRQSNLRKGNESFCYCFLNFLQIQMFGEQYFLIGEAQNNLKLFVFICKTPKSAILIFKENLKFSLTFFQ